MSSVTIVPDATDNTTPLSPQTTTAPHPFDKSNADIVLRTSDLVDFHVYSQILIAASPFFDGMFDVPQPSSDQQNLKYGKPIIDVSESSEALKTLLLICYPINKPKQWRLEDMEPALRAAMKYEMELPTTVLTESLLDLAYNFPVQVWGIACRLDLEHVARGVAEGMPSKLDFETLGDMEGITAAHYFRLNEYHRLRRLVKVSSNYRFLSANSPQETRPALAEIPSQSLADAPPPDLVCRSSDGVQFRVHKAVLSLAFSMLPEESSSVHESHFPSDSPHVSPLLQFAESSTVLLPLLKLSYATSASLPANPSDLVAVIVAAEKYGMASARPTLLSQWTNVVSTNALSAYCAAICAGHVDCAKEAARSVLHSVVDGVYVSAMEHTPALAYHRLLAYHQRCRGVAQRKLAELSKTLEDIPYLGEVPESTETPESGKAAGWGKKKGKPRSTVKALSAATTGPWLLRYIEKLSLNLQLRPGLPTPTASDLFTVATTGDEQVWCDDCHPVARDMFRIQEELKQLSTAVSEVVLEISC